LILRCLLFAAAIFAIGFRHTIFLATLITMPTFSLHFYAIDEPPPPLCFCLMPLFSLTLMLLPLRYAILHFRFDYI